MPYLNVTDGRRDGQTDERTDGRTTFDSTRGRVRAGPSLQLGTLSTRIALYTRHWRASPGVLTHADYTLGAVAPLLACVGTAHILGPGGPLPHPKNEVDRTTRSGDMAKPSADRQTYRHDLPTGQPSVLPVPSCKMGNSALALRVWRGN